MQKLLLVLGGVAWALVCFYGGLWLTFPGEQAAERAAWEVQEATGGAWKLQVADVKPWRVSGATLKDVQILSVPKARRGEEPVPSLVLRAESVSAREELIPLLSGAYMTAVDADLYGGNLSGRVGQDDKLLVIDLDGEDLDLSAYPFGGEAWSLDVGGLLQAVIDLKIDQDDIKSSKGKVDLNIEDLVLSGVNFSGFAFEQAAEFTIAHLRLKLEDGKAEVKKGKFESDLVEIEVGGDISLADPIARSRLNLTVSFKLADEIDQLAKLALKAARDDEGRYHYKASGTLSSPRFREDRVAARGTRSSSRRSTKPTTRASQSPKEDAGGDEDGSFRDDRERPGALERRRAGDERRLPERRRPELRDREPFDPEQPPGIDEGPLDDEEEFFDDEEELRDEERLDDEGDFEDIQPELEEFDR